MAGSPRYIELLAEAATRAERIPQATLEDAWTQFDGAWAWVKIAPAVQDVLIGFSAAAFEVQRHLTGTAIPRLAVEATALHVDKNAGYAGADNPDPWANFRESLNFGVAPSVGALIRLSDKNIRTVNLRRNPDNERVGEAITDTVRDAIAYPLIAVALQEEEIRERAAA